MAITHNQPTRNNLAQAVLDDIDASGNGNCVLQESAAEVATIPLLNPSFVRTNHTLNLVVTSDREDTNAAGGDPDNFVFQSGAATDVFYGVIPDDMTVSITPIPPGSTVKLSSYAYNSAV